MSLSLDLSGRVALVTGAARGLGLAIAAGLARAGALVVLNGRDPAALEQAKRSIDAAGGRCDTEVFDVTNRDAVRAGVAAIEARHGAVDILVNNAGIQHIAPIESFPPERWDAIIAINLSSNFHAIQAVLPQMKSRNWGRIINIASAHGLVASPQKAAYVAAKHGVVGLTKVVALETATTGITCNAICPGWVLTPLVQKQIDERAVREKISVDRAKMDLLSEKQPSREFATPEEIGALAVFLCSDAAAQIRGAALSIDGGWTAQ
jgi:3-hydroxybutyrate dehydrogenase